MGGQGSGPHFKFETPEHLQKLVDEYFEKTDKEFLPVYHKSLTREESALVTMPIRRPYTIEGLCLHLDITRTTLLEYEKHYTGDEADAPLYNAIIRKAKDRITLDQIERALIGENNAQFTKFNLINNSNYKDEKAIDHTSGGQPITKIIVE